MGFTGRILGVKGGYFHPNFKEYMLKEELNWSRFKPVYSSDSGWVFWSQHDHEIEPSLSLDNFVDFDPNVCATPKVRQNIRHALQKLMQSSNFLGCLVQFWAPTKTLEGRTLVTTQYEPFALGPTHYTVDRQRLCEYRMEMCREYNCFYVDAESGEEQLGLPGRVFLHKFPESTPDVKYYSQKEYPQQDLASSCGIHKSWAVPVFEHSSQTCVGVLEIVSLFNMHESSDWHDESFLRPMYDSFQEFGLICFDGYTHCERQCRDANDKAHTTAFQELNMVLRLVCEIRKLPLAMTWVPCSSCNDILRGQLMSEVLEYVVEQEDTDEDSFISDFLKVGKFSHLRKGGVSERALSSPYMLYCSDITQLSIAEYPLVHYARLCNFRGSFTIFLQSSYTDKEVYVVDFFLPTCSKDDEFILTTLSFILGTMEEKFKTFTLASGQQLGEKVWVELMDFRNGQELPFVQMIQLPSPQLLKDGRLMLQIGQLDQPSTDAIHSGMNVISEEQNYIFPSLQALQNGEATMQLDSPHQPPLDPSNYGHNGVTAEESITVVTSLQEGKRKSQRQNKGTRGRIEVTLEDILKCVGMKRKRAAEKLKVSQSTFKRVCREYGIVRWPPRTIETGSSFRPSPVENQGQTPQLNFDLPSNQAVASLEALQNREVTMQLDSPCQPQLDPSNNGQNVVSAERNMIVVTGSEKGTRTIQERGHKKAGVASINLGFQDADMVTIKAKYARYTIKFRLASLPRLVELQQEVGKRLNLEAGTYDVLYEDEENELILIACDEDLQVCVHNSVLLDHTSTTVLLKPKLPITM